MLRVLHVGLGPLGVRILGDLLARGLGGIVAAVDAAPELVGQPLSSLLPTPLPAGAGDVTITGSLDGIAGEDVDLAIVTTRSDLPACAPTFRALLERGMTIVSTCEELAWPWLRHDALARELDALARAHGGRLLGTGVNPGFLMDMLPVAASTLCSQVGAVQLYRIQDASPRRIPFQKKIGAAMTREAFDRAVATGEIRHVGLGESLHFVAHWLGKRVARWDESIAPVIAAHAHASGVGAIAPGEVRGVRQEARGWCDGDAEDAPSIVLFFQAAIDQEEPHDRVVLDATPPIDLTIRGGVHGDIATSAVVLNAARGLLAVGPGLHTMATIPLQGCAPAPRRATI